MSESITHACATALTPAFRAIAATKPTRPDNEVTAIATLISTAAEVLADCSGPVTALRQAAAELPEYEPLLADEQLTHTILTLLQSVQALAELTGLDPFEVLA